MMHMMMADASAPCAALYCNHHAVMITVYWFPAPSRCILNSDDD
jgi:hypothetical protein